MSPPSESARFSHASLCPTREGMLASSHDIGWTSLLLEHHRLEKDIEYTTRRTPDQTIFALTRGRMTLGVREGARWQTTQFQVGTAGFTPADHVMHVRLGDRETRAQNELVHLFVPRRFFEEAADHYRRAARPFRDELLSSVGFLDAPLAHAIHALQGAAGAGAPNIYAETMAQWLAIHVLSAHAAWPGADDVTRRRSPGLIGDRRLARVVEHIEAHFAEPLSLETLAREAGVSKFHFARLFRDRTGLSPHRYLVQLRMAHARSLLRSTDLSVSEIAAACGYESPAHFGAAFRRQHGVSPGRHGPRKNDRSIAKG